MTLKASRDSQAEVWQVSFQVPAALEEAATEILVMALGQSASSYCPLESDQAEISAFITQRSAWNLSKSREIQACLQNCFPELLEKSSLTFRCRKIKESDWRESWKSHFKPLEIGKRLLIKPSWSKKQPKKGQKLITLDPGLSFGTGQHATTRFCLEALEKLQPLDRRASMLDIGTGSGILAIAAACLGYQPIKAFDHDPDAIMVSKENADLNQVLPQISFTRCDLTQLKPVVQTKYDLICANLTHDLLKAHASTLLGRLKPKGYLLLAGILIEQFRAVESVYRAHGCRRIESRQEKEWQSASYRAQGEGS